MLRHYGYYFAGFNKSPILKYVQSRCVGLQVFMGSDCGDTVSSEWENSIQKSHPVTFLLRFSALLKN